MSSIAGRTQHYDQRWADRGNCAGLAKRNPKLYDTIFFPEKGRPSTHPVFEKYCKDCPVKAMCYKYALVNDLDGIWGNTTRAQRVALPVLVKMMFIEEAKQEGYLENFAIPSAPRRITVVTVRNEFEELSEEVREPGDFLIQSFYSRYMDKVERLMVAIEESIADGEPLPEP